MADKIRVLIVDDHTILRDGVRLLLEMQPDVEVVGEAADGEDAIRQADELRPDVVLMDIGMPGMNGIEATRVFKTRFPEIKVLVLTMHRTEDYFFETLNAGAYGYVLKGAATSEFIEAIRTVSRGEVFLDPTLTKKLLRKIKNSAKDPSGTDHAALTNREGEVLELLAQGFENKEVAEKLFVSVSTIHTHRTNLMRKLNLSSRRELLEYARRRGILDES